MTKILFVCHGNICRSPMAEFMLRQQLRSRGLDGVHETASAATSTEELGNDMYPPAKQCLRRHGVPFTRREARQMTADDYRRFDQIYVMDANNRRWLRHILPGAVTASPEYAGKVRLLLSLCGEERDVADPWYTGDFERTYSDLRRALDALMKTLANE